MRAITWVKERGAQFAEVSLDSTSLRAAGVAVSAEPLPYRLDYELECADDFLTRRLVVQARGASWRRRLALSRDRGGCGRWKRAPAARRRSCGVRRRPRLRDLGECPVTNTMPVLRHGLLHGGAPCEFVMAWVSVPDLAVRPSEQRYTFVGRPAITTGTQPATAVIRYESRTFRADVVFDDDGLVVDYPGLGRRARPGSSLA